MMALQSALIWKIAMLAAFGHLTHAHKECTVDDVQRVVDDLPLTNNTLDIICPDWETNPFVVIQHATHCGGSAKKTAWLEKSIKNRGFGGSPNPSHSSASMSFADPYDCTSHCVKNSEGPGHFKFKPGADCFLYRGTGMCGGRAEKDYALERANQLCDGVTTLDEPTCIAPKAVNVFPVATLSTDYTISYSVTMGSFNVDPQQNVFMSAWTFDTPGGWRPVVWNNYAAQQGPGLHYFCADPYCTAKPYTGPDLSPEIEYDVKVHYHHSLADVSICDGENCFAQNNLPSETLYVETDVDFQTVWWETRAARGTLCNLKIVDHDYQGWGRRAARALASTTDNKHTTTGNKKKHKRSTAIACEACAHRH